MKYQAKNLLLFQDTNNKLKVSVKDINIKNRSQYFFNHVINTKDFDPDSIKVYEKSYKNIFIYYVGYLSIKKDLKFIV